MASLKEKNKLAIELLYTYLVMNCPKDTGNLARNGIVSIQDNGVFYIVIGGEVADYAFATNEPWIKRPGKNPNEGWIEKTIDMALPMIKDIFKGNYSQEDVETCIANNKTDTMRQFNEMVQQKLDERSRI